MSENSYPKEARNSINRSRNRGAYDFETVHTIISQAPIVHVSFSPSAEDPFPTTLPMIGFIGSFERPDAPLSAGGLDLYLHGHAASRLMKLPANPNADTVTEEGLPICICATHVDGIVIALSPFHNSMNYRSAVVHGYATTLTDEAERLWAMERVTDAVVPGRWADSREPNNAEIKSTGILKVKIVDASAKIRTGGPNEDRKDEKDENVRGKYWTGVVPMNMTFGEPVAAPTNKVALPDSISKWVKTYNADGQDYARKAVVAQGVAKE